jgi:hypothetical protein
LRDLLDSYERHPAGVGHRLLVVFNGFQEDQDLTAWHAALEPVPHQRLRIAEPVQDLAAYRHAVESVHAAAYCFLNSYSVILQDGWLQKMTSVAADPSVGMVGASGSWGSRASHDRYELGLGGPYSRVYADRSTTHGVFARLTSATPPPQQHTGKLMPLLAAARGVVRNSIAFPAFPAPHLRTNCMLVDRDLWLETCAPPPEDKSHAYRIESGRRSVTARVRRMGLRAVVVGRDGHAYDPPDWPASRTFWQGAQENLLVGDNQTRSYRDGDPTTRQVLSAYAWGPEADPA